LFTGQENGKLTVVGMEGEEEMLQPGTRLGEIDEVHKGNGLFSAI